jgi:hypothetical protein
MSRMPELIYPDAPKIRQTGGRRKNESGMTATVRQIASGALR